MKKAIENISLLFGFYLNAESEVTSLIDRIGVLTERMYAIKVKLQNPNMNKVKKLIYIIKLKKIENNLNSILNVR